MTFSVSSGIWPMKMDLAPGARDLCCKQAQRSLSLLLVTVVRRLVPGARCYLSVVLKRLILEQPVAIVKRLPRLR
jgi:hypothetical protein